ncbi:MAG: hypothetical protein WCQ69_02585 [Bacteroidales bacterium]|jgi:hypothetical protein|nr:hypothetical protein [Bacteroidales bacterium]MDD2264655.1 hypothetical protein [Bacteroidales bacterium]MDD2832037.1 hypothetical protein [Bacteroidales bacterium]MDD3209040.1 hypothetical protein [Bacteroidales bacterium]MDD3697874.1 hypothetical protein [Bacteroidales bacterium]
MKKTPVQKPTVNKKRLVIGYANMSQQLMEIWKEKYPRGYADYMEDIMKVDKADGTFFYAVTLEIPEAIYLVKVEVKIDDYDEIEKDIFGSGDDEQGDDDGVDFPETDDSNFTNAEEDLDED